MINVISGLIEPFERPITLPINARLFDQHKDNRPIVLATPERSCDCHESRAAALCPRPSRAFLPPQENGSRRMGIVVTGPWHGSGRLRRRRKNHIGGTFGLFEIIYGERYAALLRELQKPILRACWDAPSPPVGDRAMRDTHGPGQSDGPAELCDHVLHEKEFSHSVTLVKGIACRASRTMTGHSARLPRQSQLQPSSPKTEAITACRRQMILP